MNVWTINHCGKTPRSAACWCAVCVPEACDDCWERLEATGGLNSQEEGQCISCPWSHTAADAMHPLWTTSLDNYIKVEPQYLRVFQRISV